MKIQSTHTPTPWKITKATNGDIYIGGHEWVLKMVDKVDFTTMPKESNAAYIIKAVNSYQPMVEALKEVKAVFESAGATEVFKDQYAVVCNALAQAEYK